MSESTSRFLGFPEEIAVLGDDTQRGGPSFRLRASMPRTHGGKARATWPSASP